MEAQNFRRIEGGGVVGEDVRLTAFPLQANQRELEVDLTWQALKPQVMLSGSREAGISYGGFSARFAARENTVIRADGEALHKDENPTWRKRIGLEGIYGGKRAGLRITPDSGGVGFRYQWRLRTYGFIGASFPRRTPAVDRYTLKQGKPLTLKFLVRVSG
jgi:hypothetical protein